MTEEKEMPMTKQNPPQFIPKLKGKKVVIRLVSGGQQVTGTIEGYNPNESSSSRRLKGSYWYSSML